MPPEHDLSLVNVEAGGLCRGQARRSATGAVDVCDRPARATYEVVMIVPDPGLVAGHRACRLKTAEKSGTGERAQHVVDRLVRDRAHDASGGRDEGFRVGVRMSMHGGQHRQTRLSHPQLCLAQRIFEVRRIRHTPKITPILE